MTNIKEFFKTCQKAITQHAPIAIIGVGMVALGFDASYLVDSPFVETLFKTAGAAACLTTLFSYVKRWDVTKPYLQELDEQDPHHKKELTRRIGNVVKGAAAQGFVAGAGVFTAGMLVTLGAIIHQEVRESVPINHMIYGNKQLDGVCLAPASHTFLVNGKPTTLTIDEKVTEQRFFPSGEISHSGTIHAEYTRTEVFTRDEQSQVQLRNRTITRQGTYDPKAATEGRGCIPLRQMNFGD